jgi:hypothetical protein
MMRTTHARAFFLLAPLILLARLPLAAQPLPKARVADLIVKVENGVDDFRKYLDQRGENAKDAADATKGKRAARSDKASQKGTTEARKNTAEAKKDELDDALGELNRSTNRLRRKFDVTDNWIETKAEVERVVDDGRKINQVIARGQYGAEPARLWAALRTRINDLARAYNVTPLGV